MKEFNPPENWLLTMPEDLQNEPALQSFNTPDGGEKVARAFLETKKMVGSRIPLPGPDARPEEWTEVFIKLGCPETVDGYQFQTVELPEGFPYDQEVVTAFRGKAYEFGLSNKQADGLHNWFLSAMKDHHVKVLGDYDRDVKTQVEVLQKTWGPDYDKNVTLAQKTFQRYASPEIVAAVEKTGLGNEPMFIQLFHKIGVEMSEDVLRSGPVLAAKGVEERIKEIERDPVFWSESDPKRKELVAERDRLYKQLYGEEPV